MPPDVPPSWAYPFGTTSRGQDTFWILTFAMRNTLLFGFAVAILQPPALARWSGSSPAIVGGSTDRVLMSINDTFIVIPLFPAPRPLLLRHARLHVLGAACSGHGLPRLGLRRAADPLGDDEPEGTRVHAHEHLLRHERCARSCCSEHLPYVLPIVFSTTLNNINWSIGLEVTLSVLGFTDLDTPTVGTMIFWANQHSAMVSGVWWWFVFPTLFVTITFIGLFLLAVSMNEYIDPRSRLSRMGGGAA